MLTDRLAGLTNECECLDLEKAPSKKITASHGSQSSSTSTKVPNIHILLLFPIKSELKWIFLVCLFWKTVPDAFMFPRVLPRNVPPHLKVQMNVDPGPVTFSPSIRTSVVPVNNLNLQMNLDPFRVFHYKTLQIQHRFFFLSHFPQALLAAEMKNASEAECNIEMFFFFLKCASYCVCGPR